MAITRLEILLKEKTLRLNDKTFRLDDSFFAAELGLIPRSKGYTALELKYQRKAEEFLVDEAERLYGFIGKEKLSDKLEVNFYPDTKFATVAIIGKYSAEIRNL
jgi:hypothetical protein